MNTDIQKAIQIVNKGGIIIFPTDTAFGIGCRIDDKAAVDRLFKLRRRPTDKAMPILVSSLSMALPYYTAPSIIVRRLMKSYWPGALTIVAGANTNILYAPIRGHGTKIGIRMPNHQTALSIIRAVGVPMTGSSANFHGSPTPYRLEDLDPSLVDAVDYVVKGACSVGVASTVIDCTTDPPRLIRQGAVTPII